MRPKHIYAVLFLFLLMSFSICGCTPSKFLKLIANEKVDKQARTFIDYMLHEEYDKAMKVFDPEFVNEDTKPTFIKVHTYLEKGNLISIELINARWTKIMSNEGDYKIHDLAYQLHFKNGWIVAEVIVKKQGNKFTIYGFHVNEIPNSLKDLNAFSLKDKSFFHYMFLAYAIIIPIYVILSIIFCAKSKIRKKWLWIIFILLGIGGISINWTTGQILVNILSVNLLGAGLLRSGLYGPWMLRLGFPLGAIMFFIFYKRISIEQTDKETSRIDAYTPQDEINAIDHSIQTCPKCSTLFEKIPVEFDGKKVRCGHCRQLFVYSVQTGLKEISTAENEDINENS